MASANKPSTIGDPVKNSVAPELFLAYLTALAQGLLALGYTLLALEIWMQTDATSPTIWLQCAIPGLGVSTVAAVRAVKLQQKWGRVQENLNPLMFVVAVMLNLMAYCMLMPIWHLLSGRIFDESTHQELLYSRQVKERAQAPRS